MSKKQHMGGPHEYEAVFKQDTAENSAERERLVKRVRELRAEGLSQSIIASRLGCSQSQVGRLERGAAWKAPRREARREAR